MWPTALWQSISSGGGNAVLGIVVFLLGASVGMTEIIGRYRDEPWIAVQLPVARLYIIGNGVVSVLALIIIRAFGMFSEANAIVIALSAGFGAMAIMRSKFLVLKSGQNEDIPIGLEAIISTTLSAMDRYIDRDQSSHRWQAAYDALHAIDNDTDLQHLAQLCEASLFSYQNLQTREMEAFRAAIKALAQDTNTNIGLRAVGMGLTMQAISGTDNFKLLAKQYGQLRHTVSVPAPASVPKVLPPKPPVSTPPIP